MKFRREQVDKVMILESFSKTALEDKIKIVGKLYIIIDLQYAVDRGRYSVLVLLKKKRS